MKRTPTWRIDGTIALLSHRSWEATLDIARPQFGLAALRIDGKSLGAERILGVELGRDADALIPVADWFVRGDDLAVTYSEYAERPFRVQVYWRGTSGSEDLAAIDLQISVQTSLWEACPSLTTISRIPAGEVCQLTDAGQPERVASDAAAVRTPAQAPGCFLFRSSDRDATYVEMIHPADFREARLVPSSDGGFELRHALFATDLEKGVILRARVRGLFVPRSLDAPTAHAAYRQFIAADPPLTT